MSDPPADLWSPAPRWQRQRPNTYLLAAGLILFGIMTILFPLYALSEVDARTGVPVSLTDIAQGVSVHPIGGARVFLVRESREITGFRTISPHLGAALWWCPRERVFISPNHGEVFDARGKLMWGQSAVDMQPFEVDVLDDRVLLRPEQREPPVPARPLSESDMSPDVRAVIESGSCEDRLA